MIKMLFILFKTPFPFRRYLNFCSDFSDHAGKQLDKKTKAKLKIYPWRQIVTIHIHQYTSISRTKDKQTVKFGPLIEYDLRNFFLEKLHSKCDEETTPRPFSKDLKLSVSLYEQSIKFYTIFFYCMPKISKYIEIKV